jgi:hypothetical protein
LTRYNSLIGDIDRGGVRPADFWRVNDRTIDVYDRMLVGTKMFVQRLGRSGWHRAVTAGGGHRLLPEKCIGLQLTAAFMQHFSEKKAPDDTSSNFTLC